MKTKVLILSIALFSILSCQAQLDYSISIEETTISNLYGVHSYASGSYQDNWFIFGGRTDGLHQRQPFAAFTANENHDQLLVVNFEDKSQKTSGYSSLPTVLQEQLESTNMEFTQVGSFSSIIGGYGFSNASNAHTTYPLLTVVDLSELNNAVKNNTAISSAFSSVSDTNMAVTGGYLKHLNDTFYLVGGQQFEGSYNPMGPTHGPGFYQKYTDQIRKFTVDLSTGTPQINNYHTITDAANLHRRDYNIVPQIFPDGKKGFELEVNVDQRRKQLVVDLSKATKEQFSIQVYNMKGSLLHETNNIVYKELPIKIDLDVLPSRMAIVRYSSNKYSTAQKIILR
jgi:hypothetical protein